MAIHSRVPAEVSRVDKEDAGPGHRGRVGLAHVADLKHEAHGGVQGDTLVAGQRQHLRGEGEGRPLGQLTCKVL